jgi:hypothetical protein
MLPRRSLPNRSSIGVLAENRTVPPIQKGFTLSVAKSSLSKSQMQMMNFRPSFSILLNLSKL